MTNAQEWLNSKFPTAEGKERIKKINISPSSNTATWGDFHADERNDSEVFLQSPRETTGELDFTGFTNLESLGIHNMKITVLKLRGCVKLVSLGLFDLPKLAKIDLGKNASLVNLKKVGVDLLLKITTYLDYWQEEIEELKRQLAEYEREETESQVSTESSYSDLEAKIRQKEQELNNTRDGSRRSTAPLRKEIELLKRLLGLENRVKELERKEQEYRQQLQAKEQSIQGKQQQINTLNSQLQAKTLGEQQARQQITQLNNQITNLNQEKQALQERMLRERQEALNTFQQEKSELQNSMAQLKDQKETYQKSAEYLRETLKSAEKGLEEVKKELKNVQEELEAEKKAKGTALESHQTELKNRGEAYGVVQERNKELEKKLSGANSEIQQLTTWIGKLEAVSGEGNALELLRKELEQAQDTIADLREELSSKKPRSYWWVYAIIALVAVYFLMS